MEEAACLEHKATWLQLWESKTSKLVVGELLWASVKNPRGLQFWHSPLSYNVVKQLSTTCIPSKAMQKLILLSEGYVRVNDWQNKQLQPSRSLHNKIKLTARLNYFIQLNLQKRALRITALSRGSVHVKIHSRHDRVLRVIASPWPKIVNKHNAKSQAMCGCRMSFKICTFKLSADRQMPETVEKEFSAIPANY